jgi:hypothetical protein
MYRNLLFDLFAVFILFCLESCHRNSESKSTDSMQKQETVLLTFHLELNPWIYQNSTWGDPPQIAIWMQNLKDRSIRTVLVTYRTAVCDWIGKVECSVALPYWVSFYNRQTGTKGPPTWDNPVADALTCATPGASLKTAIEVPRGTQWEVFVEVNVSGDFNVDFPNFSKEGFSDGYGNGQPSLVYRGFIEAIDGSASQPELLGRTDQYEPTDHIITDLDGITTASQLLQKVFVSCRELPKSSVAKI